MEGKLFFRFCEYPQEIIFSLKEQCKITKIQFLSHQHNIGELSSKHCLSYCCILCRPLPFLIIL